MNSDANLNLSSTYLNSFNEISKKAEILKGFFSFFSEEASEKTHLNIRDERFFSLPLIILISHTYFGALSSYIGRSFTNVSFSSRHLFECLIICKQISIDKSSAERWYTFGQYQRARLVVENSSFYEKEIIEAANIEMKKYPNIHNFMSSKDNKRYRDNWNLDKLDLYQRVEKLGLINEYKILYKEACFISHPSSSFEIYTRNGLNGLFFQLMNSLRLCVNFSAVAINEINNVYNILYNYKELTKIMEEIGGIIDGLEIC